MIEEFNDKTERNETKTRRVEKDLKIMIGEFNRVAREMHEVKAERDLETSNAMASRIERAYRTEEENEKMRASIRVMEGVFEGALEKKCQRDGIRWQLECNGVIGHVPGLMRIDFDPESARKMVEKCNDKVANFMTLQKEQQAMIGQLTHQTRLRDYEIATRLQGMQRDYEIATGDWRSADES